MGEAAGSSRWLLCSMCHATFVHDCERLVLLANVADVLAAVPVRDVPIAPLRDDDADELADLYFASYERSIVATLKDARSEIAVSFAGEYGVMDLDDSPTIRDAGDLVAAVMLVEHAPWPGSPPGPFVIDVMVHPDHRRKGLAAAAFRWIAERVEPSLALFVSTDNLPARQLYRKLGFRAWP